MDLREKIADAEWLMCHVLILSGTPAPDGTEVTCKDFLHWQKSARRRKAREKA